jgi:ABC-type Fe3+-hydroxamate transport system substrate-binding protein
VIKTVRSPDGSMGFGHYPCCIIKNYDESTVITAKHPQRITYSDESDKDISWPIHGQEIIVEYNTDDPSDFTVIEQYSNTKTAFIITIVTLIILLLWVLVRCYGIDYPVTIYPV